jgi:hypothetical protein
VSLISRAEKDVLKWKAKRLDAITRELRAIQIGNKAGLSTATIRELLGSETSAVAPKVVNAEVVTVSAQLLSFATSTALPALLTISLVTLSLHASSSSTFPPLRLLHRLITSSGPEQRSAATVIYRAANPVTGLTPHHLTFLVPLIVVGSAVVGWNILCKELGIEFGKVPILRELILGAEEWDVDWEGVREFFGMVEA